MNAASTFTQTPELPENGSAERPFKTIAAALNAAGEGNKIIKILPGTYESLIVNNKANLVKDIECEKKHII